MGTAAAAAAVLRRERDVVRHFRNSGATSPATALSLDQVDVPENIGLRRLRARAVVREAAPGTFYLDEPSWQALCRMRRRVQLIIVLLLVGFGVALYLGHASTLR